MKHHIEDPRCPNNELKYKTDKLENYAILANSLEPIEESSKEETVNQTWHMHFDGAFSKTEKGAGIVIESPTNKEFNFSYRLEFNATNNVAEYEALLLGLELCKDKNIKRLIVRGDSDLIISQVNKKFTCKSERLRRYRDAILDIIPCFDHIEFIAIPQECNVKADRLAVAASSLQKSPEIADKEVKMEVIFRPSVPNNVDNWQVFDDDKQVIKFLNSMGEFAGFHISEEEEGCHYANESQTLNPAPKKLVSLEKAFDRQDGHKPKEESSIKPCDYFEINIGTDKEPRLVKVGKKTPRDEREQIINLLREYRYVLAFTYDELKVYREDVIQHTIPLKEEAKPFR